MSYKPKTGIYETDSTINTSRTVSGTGDLIIDLPGITEFGDISGVGSGLSLSFNNAADSWSLGDNASGSSGWLISSSVGSFQIGDSSGSNGNMLIEFMHSTGVTNYISIGESNTVQSDGIGA